MEVHISEKFTLISLIDTTFLKVRDINEVANHRLYHYTLHRRQSSNHYVVAVIAYGQHYLTRNLNDPYAHDKNV
jgi:hypothetical protein